MLESFSIPISWSELLKRTAKETMDDDCLGQAAQLAYYFFLALFPAILFMLALGSFFPVQNLADDIARSLSSVASPDVVNIVKDLIQRLGDSNNGGVLTFGFATALWSSSAALVSVVSALDRAYDIEESRPWWKVRLVAIGLTIALAVFLLLSFTLIVLGPTIARHLAESWGLGSAFEWTWNIVQWPVAFLLVTTAIGLVYYFAPDAEQDWVWITPGAVVGTLLWLLVSLGFKFYVAKFTDYNAAYGAIGGVIVLMLWFYVSGLAILVGAELNAEIEHASPYGKDPGEKVPGQKKAIGVRAAREYEKRMKAQHQGGQQAPRAPERSAPLATPESAGSPKLGAAVAVPFVLARLWNRLRGRTPG